MSIKWQNVIRDQARGMDPVSAFNKEQKRDRDERRQKVMSDMTNRGNQFPKFATDDAFVRDLAKKIASKGGRVYYVGGYVRDEILGKPNKDIDIEIHNISQHDLANILRQYGNVNEQGKSFGVLRVGKYDIDISQPRREVKTGDKHTDFDVIVDPFMGTREAAKRRDFTMNALMKDVLTGDIIDHFGGLDDIKTKTIKHVDDNTFAEDSLRVLRAAQFSARFGFNIAPETKDIMRALDLSNLPRERVNEEMKKAMTKSEKPSVFFDALRETNQLDVWFPEVKAMIYSPQNERFHPEGDSYNHTMMVVDNLAKVRNESNKPYALMVAGLCHDFGKPLTVTWNEEKQIHQNIGHQEAGIGPATAFLDRVVHDNSIKEYVLEAVEKHDEPLKLFDAKSKLTRTNVFFDGLKNPEDLILITCADRTDTTHMTEKDVEYYRDWLTDRLDSYKELMSKPEIMGKDLVEMGMKPSPEFTEILKDAHSRHLRYEDKETILKSIRKKYGFETEDDKVIPVDSFVKKAFTASSKIKSGEGTYQDAMIAQRVSGDKNAGSSYDMSAKELKQAIFKAEWTETSHPNVEPPCRVFTTTDIPKGKNGIRNIEDFSDDTVFYAIDRKDTGFVGIGVAGEKASEYVSTTYLIVGPEEINGKTEDVVYTFHPGEPLKLKDEQTTSKELPDGTVLTKSQVLDMGFKHCKLMDKSLVREYEARSKGIKSFDSSKDDFDDTFSK